MRDDRVHSGFPCKTLLNIRANGFAVKHNLCANPELHQTRAEFALRRWYLSKTGKELPELGIHGGAPS
jgi:hypothetical protein